MMQTRTASERSEGDVAAMQTHADPVMEPHASETSPARKAKGGSTSGAKRPTSTQPQKGATPNAKNRDAQSSAEKKMMEPHAAPTRMPAWEGGGTRSSIFDAAGGGGTRGINVSDFSALAQMAVSPPKGSGTPTGKQMEPHASGTAPGDKAPSRTRAVLRKRLDAAAAETPALPPAEVSGAVWRAELIAEEAEREVFDAELMAWHEKEGQFTAPPPMKDPPMGESSDEGCIGEAASAVDPAFLSKVSYSRQSSKPPFLWNPYLWYLGLRSGVSLRKERKERTSGLTANRMLQAVIWMSVMPNMIMQQTRNMIEDWPLLAEATVGWGPSRLMEVVEVNPAPTWQESFGGILASNVFERYASEGQLNHGMRPTERQEHVLIAAMLARDDPVEAVALLREHNRVDQLYTAETIVAWYGTKHGGWKHGILRNLAAEAVHAHEQPGTEEGEPELAPMQGDMYEGALHLSQENTAYLPRIPFPLIAIKRGCYSEMESGGVVGLVKEDIRAAYVAGSRDGPYHIHPGSQAGYDYLLSEGTVVLRVDGQERNFVISRMNAYGKPMLAPSMAQANAAAGAGARAARRTAEQDRTIKIAYDGLPVGGKLGDYNYTQAMRVLAYRTQQMTPSPKINFNQPTDDEGYLISELDVYIVFGEGTTMEEISAQPWDKFRHVPYVAGAKPMMGFVSRKWMEKIGRKKCCWKLETACPGGAAAPCNARTNANNVAGYQPFQAASSASAWQGGVSASEHGQPTKRPRADRRSMRKRQNAPH